MSDSSVRSRSDAAATRRWVERLDRFAAGNHTVVAFCAAEGVSESNFYLWRRRLAQPPAPASHEPKVVPIRVTPLPALATPIELALPSGAVLASPPTLQTAGPAQVGPIAKGLCGPGLLAHVVTAKFTDRVPGHRLAGQLARSGVMIASSTLGEWLFQASELLTPLYELMHVRLLRSRVIHGDDTGVKLRVPGSNRTTKAHLWVCIGDADYPYVLFDFTSDDTAEGPTRFLKGFAGYFQADALAQYEALYAEAG